IDEVLDAARGWMRLVVLEVTGDGADRLVELREDPAIELAAIRDGGMRRGRRPAIDVRVGDEERVAVPDLEQEIADGIARAALEPLARLSRNRRHEQCPTDGISAVLVEHVHGVFVVLELLAELEAL